MRKVLILLLVGVLCTGASLAGYSYSVSGTVFNSSTNTVAPNASVTFEIEWVAGSGVWSGSTQIAANDGSFSFSSTSDTDFKGKNMRLKASKNFFVGSTTWICTFYSETKNVTMSSTIVINPNLKVGVEAGNYTHAGLAGPVTAGATLDDPMAPTMEVTGFRTVIAYDSTKMSCSIPPPTPDSFFDIWVEINTSGTLIVNGYLKMGSPPAPVTYGTVQSFFDIYFDILVVDPPSFTCVTVQEITELYTTTGPQYPYPNQTEYLLGEPEKCKATFLIEEYGDWEEALQGQRPYANIRPMSMTKWQQYMAYWQSSETIKQGLPYPETTFIPCTEPSGMLYVWGGGGGGGGGAIEDAGLVMAWDVDQLPEGNYASAWEYDYGLDPDLRNCTIQVTVTPPAPPPPPPVIQSHINAVSFSIIDIAGRMRTWWWSVPAAIPLGVPTTVKINTAIAGIGAATPAATGYMNVQGFNLAQSQFFDVDENFNYIFGQQPVPPPGQMQFMAWNYWHNLIVTKNTAAHKGIYIKYSQKPDVIDPNQPPLINGWDEKSIYTPQPQPPELPNPIMADDWPCNDNRPVTDIHWWGSFIGWTQPTLPPVLPHGFRIGIWTDVPDPDPLNPQDYSHPGKLIWEYTGTCTSWVWNFAGYDKDPRIAGGVENEACFQFTQLLSEDEWFHQDPNDNVYWLSIAAIYDPQAQVQYPWGWKTRPHKFNDDAVRITDASIWPPVVGSVFNAGIPIQLPPWPGPGETWDLAFEITTNEPKVPANADLNYDGFVDLADFALFAQQWLTTGIGW